MIMIWIGKASIGMMTEYWDREKVPPNKALYQTACERYAYPPSLNTSGFFDDFFDAKKDAVTTFWQVANQRLATAMASVKVNRES
jgi:hypothetical protein